MLLDQGRDERGEPPAVPAVERRVELFLDSPEAARAAESELRARHLPDHVTPFAEEVDHRFPHAGPLCATLDLRVLVQQAMRDERDPLRLLRVGH